MLSIRTNYLFLSTETLFVWEEPRFAALILGKHPFELQERIEILLLSRRRISSLSFS